MAAVQSCVFALYLSCTIPFKVGEYAPCRSTGNCDLLREVLPVKAAVRDRCKYASQVSTPRSLIVFNPHREISFQWNEAVGRSVLSASAPAASCSVTYPDTLGTTHGTPAPPPRAISAGAVLEESLQLGGDFEHGLERQKRMQPGDVNGGATPFAQLVSTGSQEFIPLDATLETDTKHEAKPKQLGPNSVRVVNEPAK